MEHISLLKQTVAYKIVNNDKENNSLSHAYLLFSQDSKYLRDYLKFFAKIIMLDNDNCKREANLINKECFSDVKIIPEKGKKITVADIDNLIEDSFIKPFESDKKLYLIEITDSMSPEAQNKLLKTLEEPPINTIIFIGALNEFALLPTIKSRTKKISIPLFTEEQLLNELKKNLPDKAKLDMAITASDGTIGNTESLYDDKTLLALNDIAIDVVNNLDKSSDVLNYCNKILSLKENIGNFLTCFHILLKDMLINLTTKGQGDFNKTLVNKITNKSYKESTLIHAIESVQETIKRRSMNANDNMAINYMLFQILEGRYKWQKL